MVFELVPFENKQSSQIGILEELAISLSRSSQLPGRPYRTHVSIQVNQIRGRFSTAVLPCHNTRKTSTCRTVLERLPSYRTRGTF